MTLIDALPILFAIIAVAACAATFYINRKH